MNDLQIVYTVEYDLWTKNNSDWKVLCDLTEDLGTPLIDSEEGLFNWVFLDFRRYLQRKGRHERSRR